LAAVYSNLIVVKEPLDLYFKPMPGSFPGQVLRVAPDLLPPGSIRIESVLMDGQPYADFDADALTVRLPAASTSVRVKVRLVPTSGVEHFSVTSRIEGDAATLTLIGELDPRALSDLRAALDGVVAAGVARLLIDVAALGSISGEGAREIVFYRAKLRLEAKVTVSGASAAVRAVLEAAEFAESIVFA